LLFDPSQRFAAAGRGRTDGKSFLREMAVIFGSANSEPISRSEVPLATVKQNSMPSTSGYRSVARQR
jgi:hypothetical protein